MVINGYKIPGGKSGLAVRYAADLIMNSPGIKQGDLLSAACNLAELNLSTAGWITSPGDKSPAMKLWTRKKEGRGYCLYPNEWTAEAVQSLGTVLFDYTNKTTNQAKISLTNFFGREPRAGDLFQLDNLNTYDTGSRGVLVGFKVISKSINATPSADGFSNSIDEALHTWNSTFEADPNFIRGPQTLATLMLKEDGRLGFYCGGFWHGRLINDQPPVWKIRVKNGFECKQTGLKFDEGFTAVTHSKDNYYFGSPSWGERSDSTSWKTKQDAEQFLGKILHDLRNVEMPPDVFEVVLI